MVLNVRADSGPFIVTQPNTAVTWAIGSTQTVTWNVANTTAAPVNCADVKISLSTDGGNTYPTILAASTPNDGSETIAVPSYPTALARIKVVAVGNVFFDVSDVNFTINTPGSFLSIDDVTVTEHNAGTTAIFTVALSPTSISPVAVNYATADGTAAAGSDYVSTSGPLTFPPGESRKTITVAVNGDTLGEANETFFVNLSGATNATISDGQGVGTITNDDCGSIPGVADGTFEAGSPWPAWTVQSSTTRGTPLCNATLGGCGAAITPYAGDHVAMFGAVSAAETATLGQTVVLPFSTSLTLRFQMRIRTVSVSPADTLVVRVDGIAVRTFAEPASPDPAYLLREVDLTPFADGGSHALLFTYTNVAPTSAYAIFLVDNVELFSCPPTGVVNTCLADGTFEAGSPWPAWTVQTSTGYGTPLCNTALCGTGAPPFAGGNWAWFGGAAAPETATLGQAVVLPLFSSPLLRFQMRVEVTAPPTDTLVVSVDGTPVQTFIEPASSESEYSVRQIDLTPFANGGSHALLFTYNGPTNGVGNFHVDNVQLLCLPAPPSLSINDIVLTEGDPAGIAMARFTVSLSAASGQTVTVAYATGNGTATAGSDYVSASGTVTFAPGTTTQFIDIPVGGDALDEPNETFFVNLSSATNATISDGQGLATISDDDLPPSLSVNDVTVNENSTATFTVTLSAVSGQQVTVAYMSVDGTATTGTDYTATSGTLIFAPGVTMRSIVVPVNGDTTDEPDEVFFVNVGSPVNATIADGQGVGTVVNRPDIIFRDGFQ
jgi:chitinase